MATQEQAGNRTGDHEVQGPNRKRSCRIGSFLYADTYGVYGDATIIQLGPSSVCKGLGVFATRTIPKGTPITRYHGELVKHVKPACSETYYMDCAYTYQLSSGKGFIIGARDMSRLKGRGVGQLLNDAIDPDLSGRKNNCEFCERGSRVYIVASRNISPGEELMVDYSISYWISMAREPALLHPPASSLPPEVKRWAAVHRSVEDALKRVYGSQTEIYTYDSGTPLLGSGDDGGGDAHLSYTVLVKKGRPLAAVWGCGCKSYPDRRKCAVLLGRGDTGQDRVSWRCRSCDMAGFRDVWPSKEVDVS